MVFTISLFFLIIAVILELLFVKYGWILYFLLSFYLIVTLYFLKKKEWIDIPELSIGANRLFKKFGHYYTMPFASYDHGLASITMWFTGIILFFIDIYKGYLGMFWIGIINFFLMSFVAGNYNPSLINTFKYSPFHFELENFFYHYLMGEKNIYNSFYQDNSFIKKSLIYRSIQKKIIEKELNKNVNLKDQIRIYLNEIIDDLKKSMTKDCDKEFSEKIRILIIKDLINLNNKDKNMPQEIKYLLNTELNKLLKKQSEDESNIINNDNDNKYYDGEIKEYFLYYDDKSIKQMLSRKNNGLLHGKFLKYYPNGKIKISGQYFQGNKSGEWLEYDENGNIISSKKYDEQNDDICNYY